MLRTPSLTVDKTDHDTYRLVELTIDRGAQA